MKYYLVIIIINCFVLSLKAQNTSIKVFGIVKDAITYESLASAEITIMDSIVAYTNSQGIFTFYLNQGIYTINIKMIGYEAYTQSLNIKNKEKEKEQKLVIQLSPKPIRLKTVTVAGSFNPNNNYKSYTLQKIDLVNIPQLGEQDAFRAMFALPGVVQINDFNTQLYVQGSNFDETLISIDNIPTYNPYHLGGFFGLFNPDIILEQTLYTSNYPLKYGGYLSGVFNISTKEGNRQRIKGSASIGLMSSKLFLEGPLLGGTFLLSGRRTYFDLIADLVFEKDFEFPYNFSDYYLKYTYPLDSKNLLSVSTLFSNDIYKIYRGKKHQNSKIIEQPNWGNQIIALSYTHLFEKNNVLQLKLYTSESFNLANANTTFLSNYVQRAQETFINNKIIDYTINLNWEFELAKHQIELGSEVKKLNLNYDWNIGESELTGFRWDIEDMFYDYAKNPYKYNSKSYLATLYLIDQILINKKSNIIVGLRGTHFSKLNKIITDYNILFNYNFNQNQNIKIGFSKHSQFLYTIKDNKYSNLFAPYSVFFMSEKSNNLAQSYNFMLSAACINILDGIDLEAEAYYKIRTNLASSYNLAEHYRFENGKAIGTNIVLKKPIGKITGWFSYSFSRSIKYDEQYSYFAPYDRTHSIKTFLSFKLSNSWQFSSFWIVSSGLPYTPFVGKYIYADADEYNSNFVHDGLRLAVIEGKKNSNRLPVYHRLDIGISGSFFWGNIFVKPYLQIMNLYNSPNYYFIEDKATNKRLGEALRSSIILPTLGLSVEF